MCQVADLQCEDVGQAAAHVEGQVELRDEDHGEAACGALAPLLGDHRSKTRRGEHREGAKDKAREA